MGQFCENWAVKVKTGLIPKMSLPKELKVEIGLLGKIGAFREQ